MHEVGGAVERDPDPPLAPGEPVGEWVVERLLGAGASGSVYEARRPAGSERVAIKVLHRRCSVDPRALARFAGEARAAQRVGHPNIVGILGLGELPDGRRYHVMELVEGGTLSQLLAARGALSPSEAVPILRGVAEALAAVHAQGIAHRDLKPDNVLVATDAAGLPVPRLVDFGIAKLARPGSGDGTLTETGTILGTPHYMAPEQTRDAAVDHRADVYAFGILAYRVLTGRLPFTGEDSLEVLLQHRREPPVPPSRVHPGLPPAADAPILAMLAKAPGQRPSSVASAFGELERALTTPGDGRTGRTQGSRARWVAVVGALVLAGAGAVVAVVVAGDPGPAQEARRALTRPTPATPASTGTAALRAHATPKTAPRPAPPRSDAPQAGGPPEHPAKIRAHARPPGPEDVETAFQR